MFRFGKQKTKKEATELTPDANLEEQIHVMPKRFYVPAKKKRTFLVVIIIVGLFLIGGLAVAAYYFSLELKNNQGEPANINQPININSGASNFNENSNLNQNLNQNIDSNANLNITATTTAATSTNINVNVNTNSNANTNVNTNPDLPQPLSSAPDLDLDNLTLAEESLYGTNPEVSDSDGDGYKDGEEILNGYDPTRPVVKATDSGLFGVYENQQYSIIYPKKWEVKKQGENEVLFVSSTGEFVEILVIPNPNNLSLENWYQEQFPQINFSQVVSVRINNFIGLRHPDQQNYYLISENDKTKIFVLTYNTGNFTLANFKTTFQAMVKSFRLTL